MENYLKGPADRVRSFIGSHDMEYQQQVSHDPSAARQCMKLHDLPAIHHYWSNAHLAPHKFHQFGITDPEHFFINTSKNITSGFLAGTFRSQAWAWVIAIWNQGLPEDCWIVASGLSKSN